MKIRANAAHLPSSRQHWFILEALFLEIVVTMIIFGDDHGAFAPTSFHCHRGLT
jgi:hypothetical protein